MINEHYDSLIEKYFSATLTDVEKAETERLYRENQTFRDELDLQKKLRAIITDDEMHKFVQILKKTDKETLVSTSRKFLPPMVYAVAAAIALLIAVFLYFNSSGTPDAEKLFAENYVPYQFKTTIRGNGQDSLLAKATAAYQSRDYRTATDILEQLSLADTSEIAYFFYTGMSQLADNQFANAAINLEKVLRTQDDQFSQQAEWYLGLIRLRQENKTAAIQHFQSIAAHTGHYRQQEAKGILSKISSWK
ncbi:MAG: hypothetical protein R3D00_19050 [Bacteroidia bacterium]